MTVPCGPQGSWLVASSTLSSSSVRLSMKALALSASTFTLVLAPGTYLSTADSMEPSLKSMMLVCGGSGGSALNCCAMAWHGFVCGSQDCTRLDDNWHTYNDQSTNRLLSVAAVLSTRLQVVTDHAPVPPCYPENLCHTVLQKLPKMAIRAGSSQHTHPMFKVETTPLTACMQTHAHA